MMTGRLKTLNKPGQNFARGGVSREDTAFAPKVGRMNTLTKKFETIKRDGALPPAKHTQGGSSFLDKLDNMKKVEEKDEVEEYPKIKREFNNIYNLLKIGYMDRQFPQKVLKWAEKEWPTPNPAIKGVETLRQSTTIFSANCEVFSPDQRGDEPKDAIILIVERTLFIFYQGKYSIKNVPFRMKYVEKFIMSKSYAKGGCFQLNKEAHEKLNTSHIFFESDHIGMLLSYL